MSSLTNAERELAKLYSIFHLLDEDYITSVKLCYIYSYVSNYTSEPLLVIRLLRSHMKHKSRIEYVDYMYRAMKFGAMTHNHNYQFSTHPPVNTASFYYYLGHKIG